MFKVTARVKVAEQDAAKDSSPHTPEYKILPSKSAIESRFLVLGSFIQCSDVITQNILDSVHLYLSGTLRSLESNTIYLVVDEIIYYIKCSSRI